jgi:hypothetical protein
VTTFPLASQSLYSFFRSHDLDPDLYQIHITTRSPLALDQLRLALSSDFKHLFRDPDAPWPRNHFVGWFKIHGLSFRTGFGEPPEHHVASLEET